MQTIRNEFTKSPSMLKGYYRTLTLPRSGYQKDGFEFPHIELTWVDAKINKRHMHRYQNLCQLPKSDAAPLLYPHVLMGSMHLALLSHEAFPMSVFGGLHLHTETIQHRAMRLGESYNIHASIKRYRIVRQGFEFDIDTQVKQADKVVWESRNVYLLPGKYDFDENKLIQPKRQKTLEDTATLGQFNIPRLIGKRYAILTGDINPIHMNRLAAIALGQKQDIAHAMWALGTTLGKMQELETGEELYLSASFKGPLFIGKLLNIKGHSGKMRGAFDLYCGDNQRPSICAVVRKSFENEKL